MYADQRETRTINHEFITVVHVWFSDKAKKKDGHGIYVTPKGRFIEGTTHTEEKKNPYLEEYCDGEYVGMAVKLQKLIDVPKWLPMPEMIDGRTMKPAPSSMSCSSCNFITLSALLYTQLLSLSGMTHED